MEPLVSTSRMNEARIVYNSNQLQRVSWIRCLANGCDAHLLEHLLDRVEPDRMLVEDDRSVSFIAFTETPLSPTL